MNREEMARRLERLMRDKFKLDLPALEDRMRLNEDLRIDSIMMVQLIVFLELELRLQVPDDAIDPRAFATVGSLLDYMEGLEPIRETAAGSEGGR